VGLTHQGYQKEAYAKLPVWENELIDKQSRMAGNLLSMSATAYDIRTSLLELTTCLEIQFVQYGLIKHTEVENLKAQIETYKAEVDLLRQENYELETEKEDGQCVDALGEDVEVADEQDI
jgi:hypothetical protein